MMISIIGVGRLGSAVAMEVARREIGDITLIDIIEGLPQGEALDLSHMIADMDVDVDIRGSNDYRDIEGSDLIISIAGSPRKPGMTRMDLLTTNAKIVKDVAKNISQHVSKANIIQVANPMDVMTYLMMKFTGFDPRHVVGFGGILDSMRFRYFLASEIGVSYSSVSGMVIGEHGETMMPLTRFAMVNGIPVSSLLSNDRLEKIVESTRKVAAEVIRLKGATVFGPAHGVARMAEAIAKDKKIVEPCSAYLRGEYGINDVYIGVPVVLGKDCVEKIIELPLNEQERDEFRKSAEVVKSAIRDALSS